MNQGIAPSIRKKVLEEYLKGKTVAEIAQMFDIARGSVSNIVNEWIAAVGRYDAEAVREFALEVKKRGTTVPDCLVGARVLGLIKEAGIQDERAIEEFLKALAATLADKLALKEMAEAILDLVAISKQTGIPLRQVPEYVQKKREELQNIRNETAEALKQKEDAEKARDESFRKRDEAIAANKITLEKLDQYIKDREGLEENDLSMDDPAKAVQVLKHIKEQKSGEKILVKMAGIESLEVREQELKGSICRLEKEESDLDKHLEPKRKEKTDLEEKINTLKPLAETLETSIRIAKEHGIQTMDQAARKTIGAVESQAQVGLSAFKTLFEMNTSLIKDIELKQELVTRYIELTMMVKEFEPFIKRNAGRAVSDFEYYTSCIAVVHVVAQSLPPQYRIKANAFTLQQALQEYLVAITKRTTV